MSSKKLYFTLQNVYVIAATVIVYLICQMPINASNLAAL
jgi:hypothetical protein